MVSLFSFTRKSSLANRRLDFLWSYSLNKLKQIANFRWNHPTQVVADRMSRTIKAVQATILVQTGPAMADPPRHLSSSRSYDASQHCVLFFFCLLPLPPFIFLFLFLALAFLPSFSGFLSFSLVSTSCASSADALSKEA